MRCAVVNGNNVIENIIMAEPTDPAPHGCVLIGITDFCDIGWIWNGSTFINPNPPVVQSPANEVTSGD